MADISNVINVQVLEDGLLASRDNVNIVAIITSEKSHLNGGKRFDVYRSSTAVAEDFGTLSKTNDFATSFFATKPNPISAGGLLIIGYWQAGEEVIPESHASVTGITVTGVALTTLQGITNGSFKISIDGASTGITGLNFSTITTMEEAVALIRSAIFIAFGFSGNPTATGMSNKNLRKKRGEMLDKFKTSYPLVLYENGRITINSPTSGVDSTVSAMSEASEGTYLGTVLGLDDNGGVSMTQGKGRRSCLQSPN